jgi:hypothetical protein
MDFTNYTRARSDDRPVGEISLKKSRKLPIKKFLCAAPCCGTLPGFVILEDDLLR